MLDFTRVRFIQELAKAAQVNGLIAARLENEFLVFILNSQTALDEFNATKEQIIERLRNAYKLKLSVYKAQRIIFKQIKARVLTPKTHPLKALVVAAHVRDLVLVKIELKTLLFVVKSQTALDDFNEQKEQILERLRAAYKANMSAYKQGGIIFNKIDACILTRQEVKEKSKGTFKNPFKSGANYENVEAIRKTILERQG